MMEEFRLHPQLQQDSILLAQWPLCSLLLSNDSHYPWFILVPRVADIQEIYQLDWQQQQQLLNESSLLSELLMQLFQGDKLNIAALGNICPQLHLHHVVRFKTDISWPDPIWGKQARQPYSEGALAELQAKLGPALDSIFENSAQR